MSSQLNALKKSISTMRLGKIGNRLKPHKPLMLLVVLDLFDNEQVKNNRIFYNRDLVERFQQYFEAVKREGDWCQPAPPFFHLRSSSFWKHKPIPGREEQYSQLTSSGGGSKRILENIQYAYLEDEAYNLLSLPNNRQELRSFILENFFSTPEQSTLQAVIAIQDDISTYEQLIKQQAYPQKDVQPLVRSAAFRRIVLHGYDYQCAVCGLRLIIPDIPSPIDAAHLIPWSETNDDTPNNGIALCKLHHWALDANLISPNMQLCWKVSSLLDDRRNSESELTRFRDLQLLLPSELEFYPKPEAIKWRLKHLAK